MRMKQFFWLLIVAAILIAFTRVSAKETKDQEPRWPQFRGPDGLGVARNGGKYPTRFGPDSNLLWKTPLPSGNSSPCVWGNRIFVTAFEKQKQLLETLCLDRRTGHI